ncbi:MAG TPA: ABC transporter permease [Streptosporangiaceae bacterium]|jgi:ABC-type antimicrobial peptide transport system permease subunit
MFFTYLRRELRRRMRQATFIAIGLAIGIGLVITVTAASSGVKNAQGSVLRSLYGVGTDITVSKTPTAGSGGPGSFGFAGRTGTRTRPAAGTKINVNNLRAQGAGTIAASSVSKIAGLDHVAAAAGGLTLTDTKITGSIPAINSSGSGSGGSGSTGGFGGGGSGGSGGGFRGSFTPTSFTVDGVDIGTGELGPLSNGKLTKGATFTSADSNSNVALLDSDYATQNKLTTGSTVDVAGTSFKVVGVVSEAASDNPPDVYIPLARAQALGSSGTTSLKDDVTTVYVAATSSNEIASVQKAIDGMLPGATVTTSASLANEVTGSITSAASLANDLGKWLAIAVLIAAFLLAALLTMSSVSRRVREFGTLKALGWPGRRVVGQVMGESLVIGIIGGAVGVALGFAGAEIVSKVSKPLTASLGSTTTGSATPGGARSFGGFGGGGGGGGTGGGTGGFGAGGGNFFHRAADTAQTVSVHLSASVTVTAIVLAVALAIAGGLIAGGFGGWRAARMRPAAALARVE